MFPKTPSKQISIIVFNNSFAFRSKDYFLVLRNKIFSCFFLFLTIILKNNYINMKN